MGISKTNILLVAAATIILSGLLLPSSINDDQIAFAGPADVCKHVFLPSDPVELSVTKIPPTWFRTTIAETDTLDCEDSSEAPFVRELSLIIMQDTNHNNADKGTTIKVISCDTMLHTNAQNPGAIAPVCTTTEPSSNIPDTTCVPSTGVSFIETDSEWFEFTTGAGKIKTKSKTVTLEKSVYGCAPDSLGVPQKFYEVFTMFELFGSKTTPAQHTILCVKDVKAGTIDGCAIL